MLLTGTKFQNVIRLQNKKSIFNTAFNKKTRSITSSFFINNINIIILS